MGNFWQNFGKMGWGSTPRCPREPANRFQPFADELKQVTPEASPPDRDEDWKKCQKRVQMSPNVPETCSDTGECLQEVSVMYH